MNVTYNFQEIKSVVFEFDESELKNILKQYVITKHPDKLANVHGTLDSVEYISRTDESGEKTTYEIIFKFLAEVDR